MVEELQQVLPHSSEMGYIHIGVGSNVVCSTAIGNARASIRGMDNSDSTLFVSSCDPLHAPKEVRYEHIV